MKDQTFIQFAFVRGETPEDFEERLNARLYDLRGKNPEVKFEGLFAQIKYTERTDIPESIEEEYSVKGLHITCKMCPYFIPTTKADGTEDARAKWGYCPLCDGKRTTKGAPACDVLYMSITNGTIKLTI